MRLENHTLYNIVYIQALELRYTQYTPTGSVVNAYCTIVHYLNNTMGHSGVLRNFHRGKGGEQKTSE